MVLDLISASYIGWPNPAFVIRSFDTARVVQGERRAELARAMLSRSPHSQSISLMLCKGCDSKFRASIWGSFQHKIAELKRTVISRPRSRKYRPSKITFR